MSNRTGACLIVPREAGKMSRRRFLRASVLTVDWPGHADAAPHFKWLPDCWARIVPHADGFYTNDARDETQKQLDDNSLGNLARLVKQNSRHDPTNLFRLSANVRPSEASRLQ
jgi:hypothetical protein